MMTEVYYFHIVSTFLKYAILLFPQGLAVLKPQLDSVPLGWTPLKPVGVCFKCGQR